MVNKCLVEFFIPDKICSPEASTSTWLLTQQSWVGFLLHLTLLTAFFVITLSTHSFLIIHFSIINAANLENSLQESGERERARMGILRRKAQLDMSNQYYALP